ncbi:MAG: hypothetical protein NTX52_14465 [Planctomycetota bacterium]|nr:hypothetical protein [Planctomycetota bacterium]
MDISKQGEVDSFQIAKQVDELVGNPATMERWRLNVEATFRRPEVVKIKDYIVIDKPPFEKHTASYNQWVAIQQEIRNVWFKWLRSLDPHTHIDVLYTLLAFCHDDFLRINCIVTDELKKQAPLLCDQMTIYCVNGIPNSLDIYLSYVERDLAAQQDLQRQQPKEAEKSEETEQKTTVAKCRRIWICVKRIPRWIYVLVIFLAALLGILEKLGCLDPIKRLFTR